MKNKMFLKGFKKLRKEVEIASFIKQIRIMKTTLQSLVEQKDWEKFKKESGRKSLWYMEEKKQTEKQPVKSP